MASPESQSSLTKTTTDEFEGLEVIEFDPNLLQELLYGPVEEGGCSREVKEEVEMGGASNGDTGKAGDESWWQFDEYKDDNRVRSLNWFDVIMEETCDEMGIWGGGGQCVEEVNQVYEYEYSSVGGVVVSDEIAHIGLWQDN